MNELNEETRRRFDYHKAKLQAYSKIKIALMEAAVNEEQLFWVVNEAIRSAEKLRVDPEPSD